MTQKPIPVSDKSANKQENIQHAAEALGRSKARWAVFRAVYFGKKRVKTVNDIAKSTGLSCKRVLEEGKRLVYANVISQTKTTSGTGYEKDSFLQNHYTQILKLAGDFKAIQQIPTKRNRTTNSGHYSVIKVLIDRKKSRAKLITIDEIDSFGRISGVSVNSFERRSEITIKKLFKKIFGEKGKFTDWGGEKNDLFTTRLRLRGQRLACAIAFKGWGTKGVLTPGKMGRNGDQIQRLFNSSAQMFLVQYCGQIDERVVEQMEAFAHLRADLAGGNQVTYYGVIDGLDTERLFQAYSP